MALRVSFPKVEENGVWPEGLLDAYIATIPKTDIDATPWASGLLVFSGWYVASGLLLGVWPEGLLDAYIVLIPKNDGDATPLGQRPLCVLPVVFRIWAYAQMGQLEDWFQSWVPDSVLGAGGGRGSVEARYAAALDIEEVSSGAVSSDTHLFVADVFKSFDTVDRGIWDRVLSSLGLPAWFLHTYFECHVHFKWRFKIAAGLGEPWTRDGAFLRDARMMFIVASYLP